MKKLTFLLGLGAGFLLGSKTGHGPYQELERQVRALANRPDVQDVIENTKEAAHEAAAEAVDTVSTKLATATGTQNGGGHRTSLTTP